jgi:hypothetical protein
MNPDPFSEYGSRSSNYLFLAINF